MTEEWQESSVTWNSPWSTSGGDFNSSAVDQNDNSSTKVWEDFNVTSVIKDIVENSSYNYGFLIKFITSSSARLVQYESSESSDQDLRPKLTVEYEYSNPTIILISANGGEEWEQYTTHTIAWDDNIDGPVKIDIIKNGSVIETIASSVPSNGSYEWKIPEDFEPGSDYKVKITSIDDPTLFDESDESFSIAEEYIIALFPYEEDFDDLETNTIVLPIKWEQLDMDDLDWLVWTGKTPSKEPDQGAATGPDGDHTSGSGNYIYLESSSPNNPDKKADYITAKINLNILSNPSLSFWYHMFSDNEGTDEMGDLYLDIDVDGTVHKDVVHLSKDHGDEWFEQTVDLSNYQDKRVRFLFRAVTGSGWASDICIDDLRVDGATANSTIVKKVPYFISLKYYNSRICFQIPKNFEKRHVNISLYNLQGKLIKTIVNSNMSAGYHSVHLDKISKNNQQLGSGIYLCRMKAEGFTETISIIVGK